jgi:hypothetical protein
MSLDVLFDIVVGVVGLEFDIVAVVKGAEVVTEIAGTTSGISSGINSSGLGSVIFVASVPPQPQPAASTLSTVSMVSYLILRT